MKKPGEILDGLVLQLREAELTAVEREADLKAANKRVRDILEQDIPSIMAELGAEKFTTPSGIPISVKDDPKSSVTKADMPAFIEVLDATGHGGIVKRELVVAFAAGTETETKELLDRLKLKGYAAKMDGTVNYQTLQKWVRGRLEEGEDIPKLVTVFDRKVAKVG